MLVLRSIHSLQIFSSFAACVGDMENVSAFNPVSTLSSDGEIDPGTAPPPRPKGKRPHRVLEEAVRDEGSIRAMLGKPKCHCKRQCLLQFTDDESFAQLKAWRDDWSSMHKLDQDQFDALLCSSKAFPMCRSSNKNMFRCWRC